MSESFTADELQAWGGFLRVHAMLFDAIERDLKKRAGLTHVEFEVLLRLSHAKGRRARIQTLVEHSLLSQSGTSRAVNRLVSSGLIERVAATEDRRGAYAVLTPRGATLFDKAARDHVALVRRIFLDQLSPEQLQMLGRIWQQVSDADVDVEGAPRRTGPRDRH